MTTEPITLNQLESHLWEAANMLRGPVDAAFSWLPRNLMLPRVLQAQVAR